MTRVRRFPLRNRPWCLVLLLASFLIAFVSTFTPSTNHRIQAVHLASSVSASEEITTKPSLSNVQEQRKEQTANNNVQQKRQIQREPWRASFHVSKKTQQKIQQAAVDKGGSKRTNAQRASAVLNALLNMPPERCNAANLVCALTLSAKVLGSHSRPNDKFRSLLFQALEILGELVEQEGLHTRQLCNAVWAVAKHYDRDPLLLPESLPATAICSQQVGVAETWDLSEGGDEECEMSPADGVDATVQAIARQLTGKLREEAANRKEKARPIRETKIGEICMASWAYGVLRPRQRPPGWLQPPQMGKLSKSEDKLDESQFKRTNDFMSFERWTMNEEDLSFLTPAIATSDDDANNDNAAPKDAADELFDTISEALCRPLEDETFATSSMYEPQFELMRLTDCTWSEIANLAWAFEKRGRCLSTESEMLLRALSREAAWRLRTGGRETKRMLSRDISQLIWALGTLQQDNFRLAHDLVALVDDFSDYLGLGNGEENARHFAKWSCPDLVQMISSLSHARIDNSRLLLALFEEAYIRLDKGIYSEPRRQEGRKVFLSWEVCVMLWAQARLHLTPNEGDVYADFPQRATSCITSAAKNKGSLSDIGIGPQEQANVAWSLTVLQQHQSKEAVELLRGVFRDAANTCEEDGLIQLEHAHQLWQALFLLEEESPSAVSQVPTWFRDHLSDKWNLEKSKKKISSARHKSISDLLNLMGIAHYNEHDEDIDVAIVLKNQASWAHQTEFTGEDVEAVQLAVEFDGPNHFTRKNIPRDSPVAFKPVRALGHTVLKYRLLKRKGWTVIRVPYYEFDKIPFWASMERQRYLQRLLKTHANIRFSDVDISEYSSMGPNRKTRFD